MAKPLRDLHDVELAALSAAGGRREFGELVRRHSPAVRGLLRRMGAQPALADDVAQDAFIAESVTGCSCKIFIASSNSRRNMSLRRPR